MNIATFDTLIPATIAIQPHLAWMLATVPDMIDDPERASQVQRALEDLNVKFARLSGRILELESRALPISAADNVAIVTGDGDLTLKPLPTDVPTVFITTDGSVKSLRALEEILRDFLAEIIVSRGEAELKVEKEAMFAELYGGLAAKASKEDWKVPCKGHPVVTEDEAEALLAERELAPYEKDNPCPCCVKDQD